MKSIMWSPAFTGIVVAPATFTAAYLALAILRIFCLVSSAGKYSPNNPK